MATIVGQLEARLLAALQALRDTPEIYQRNVAGLDDLVASGTAGSGVHRKDVEIVGTSGGDTMRWRTDSGAWSSATPCTGAAQDIGDGYFVTLATTGHVVGDSWSIQNGPVREVITGAFDGTESGALQLVSEYTTRVPILIMGLAQRQWESGGVTARRLVSTISWSFAAVCDMYGGEESDQQLDRRDWLYLVEELFAAAIIDAKLAPVTTPIWTEFTPVLGQDMTGYNNVGTNKLFVGIFRASVIARSACGSF